MTSLSGSFWDQQVLRPAATVHSLRVGGQAILFDDGLQQIFTHNDSSAAIWDALIQEATIAGAARSLATDEDHYRLVLQYCRDAAVQWLRSGLMRPAQLPAAGDIQTLTLEWMGCCVEARLSGAIDALALRSLFEGFVSDRATSASIEIHEMGGLVFISDGSGKACARDLDAWAPEVKARFTSAILATVEGGFLAHAALLSRHGQGLLLCGAPGAGKTTTSVSLLAAGFDYHTDDIVWIGDDAQAAGAPFAPALKEGSWPLLQQIDQAIATSPTYLRSDGQSVRYLLPRLQRQAPVKLGSILLLARQAAGPASIEALEPLEVLTAILESAYSSRGAISPLSLKALAAAVEDARIGRMHFSDWRDAKRLIDAFAP